MKKIPFLRMLYHAEQIIIDYLKKISSKRELYVYIMCFLIRGIRWKTNLDGPLGPRWRKSNMIKFK